MKEIKYENVKIYQAEQLLKMKCEDEAIYSADGKKILLKEEAIIRRIGDIMQPVIDAFIAIGKAVMNIAQPIAKCLLEVSKKMANKKITRKRFIKLLQSEGIQRNEINKIIKDNKEKYTYARLFNTVDKYYKEQQK